MATLIPAHREKVPQLMDVRGNFKSQAIFNDRNDMPKYWKEIRETMEESNKNYNLFGKEILVISYQIHMSVGMQELEIDFIFPDPAKSIEDAHLWIEEMKKYGKVTINCSRDYAEYDVPDYVKYDFDHTYYAGKGAFARVTDEIPNFYKEIFFKVFIYRPRKYYCCDCNDYHTTNDEITTRIVSTKQDAFNFIKSWSGNTKLRRVKKYG